MILKIKLLLSNVRNALMARVPRTDDAMDVGELHALFACANEALKARKDFEKSVILTSDRANSQSKSDLDAG